MTASSNILLSFYSYKNRIPIIQKIKLMLCCLNKTEDPINSDEIKMVFLLFKYNIKPEKQSK